MENVLTSTEFFNALTVMALVLEIVCCILLFVFMGIYFKLSRIISNIEYLKNYDIKSLERAVGRVQEDVREIRFKR